MELREAAGRHDGSFMGATYFECAPLHGVLCQVAQLKVMVGGLGKSGAFALDRFGSLPEQLPPLDQRLRLGQRIARLARHTALREAELRRQH